MTSRQRHEWLRLGLGLAWLAGAILLLNYVGSKCKTITTGGIYSVKSPPLASLDPKVVNIIALGHRGVLENFFNLWMVQILVDEKFMQGHEEVVLKAIDDVANHRVRIETFYMLACYVAADELEAPKRCENIAEKGLEAFPTSWRIPITMGYTYYHKLDDPIRAAAYYAIASSREESPEYVRRVAEKLAAEEYVPKEVVKEVMLKMLKFEGNEAFFEVLRRKNLITPEEEELLRR